MLQLILHIYVFLAWTGSWSSHSGFGAFFFCCLWLTTLGLGLFSAFIAPSFLTVIISLIVRACFGKNAGRTALNIVDIIDVAVNGVTFMIPILAVAGIALFSYFGSGWEELHGFFPSLFPAGGYFFSDAPVPFYAYVVIGYLAWTYYSVLDRFEVTDGIKANMPVVKEKSVKLLSHSGQWIGENWEKYAPIVRDRSITISAQILKQAQAFGRLSVEISRHFAMRLGLLAMSGGTGKIKGNKSTGDNILSSIRNRISEHRGELKFLWRESRYFTLSLGVTVVLVILILILI